MVLNWQLTFVVVAGNKEQLSNVSHAKPSSQRRVTGAEFVEKLKQMLQNFPNGLAASKLAAFYKVYYIIFLNIIRPHRSATYVHAAYCYQPSSVVCQSVCLSVTLVSPAKTAAPIEIPFWLRTLVGPRNHVLDGGPDPPWEGAILLGKGHPIVKYRDTLRSSVRKQLNRSRCRWFMGLVGP